MQHAINAKLAKAFAPARKERAERKQLYVLLDIRDEFHRAHIASLMTEDVVCVYLKEGENLLQGYLRLAPDMVITGQYMERAHSLVSIYGIDHDHFVIALGDHLGQSTIMQALQMGLQGFIKQPYTPLKCAHYLELVRVSKRAAKPEARYGHAGK